MSSQVEKAANTFSRRILSSAMLARTPLGLKSQQNNKQEQRLQRPFDTDSVISESSMESEGSSSLAAEDGNRQIDNQGEQIDQESNRSANSSANSTTRITQESVKMRIKKRRTFFGIPLRTFMSIFFMGFGCGALSVIVFFFILAATLPDDVVPVPIGTSNTGDNPKAAGLIGQRNRY